MPAGRIALGPAFGDPSPIQSLRAWMSNLSLSMSMLSVRMAQPTRVVRCSAEALIMVRSCGSFTHPTTRHPRHSVHPFGRGFLLESQPPKRGSSCVPSLPWSVHCRGSRHRLTSWQPSRDVRNGGSMVPVPASSSNRNAMESGAMVAPSDRRAESGRSCPRRPVASPSLLPRRPVSDRSCVRACVVVDSRDRLRKCVQHRVDSTAPSIL
jgi:hypothetical protein